MPPRVNNPQVQAEPSDTRGEAWRTAITRRGLSVPTRELIRLGYLQQGSTTLNHGRGKADDDAAQLKKLAGKGRYAEYDFHFAPDRAVLDNRYDTVVSNFVLNVLEPNHRHEAWKDIANSTGGTAYITVRSTGDKSIRGEPHEDGVLVKRGKKANFQKPYSSEDLVDEAGRYFNTVELVKTRSGGNSWTIAASDPIIQEDVEIAKIKTLAGL